MLTTIFHRHIGKPYTKVVTLQDIFITRKRDAFRWICFTVLTWQCCTSYSWGSRFLWGTGSESDQIVFCCSRRPFNSFQFCCLSLVHDLFFWRLFYSKHGNVVQFSVDWIGFRHSIRISASVVKFAKFLVAIVKKTLQMSSYSMRT